MIKVLNSISPGKRKLVFWMLGLLVFYTVAGFLILPPIIRSVAVSQLSRQLDRKVSIEKVKLNPFALSATVDGLLIAEKDGTPFVSWDEVYVNFQLSSFFGKAWVFKEISTTKPFVHVQMNRDYTFNFSDLITKFSTNATPATTKTESKPLVLRIGRLHIGGATAAYADLTPREPFYRTLGPLDITLENFRTDPENKNPYSFAGTTDAGERIAWSGYFYLSPLRSEGDLTLDNLTLNKYAPLYQDLVRFVIRDGSIGLHVNYQFELSASNRVAIVNDASFALRNLKVAPSGASNNIAELPFFSINGASADLQNHRATIDSVVADGSKLFLTRGKDAAINVVELSKPAAATANAPGGILLLLHSVTNVVATLLNSTNHWSATVRNVVSTNGSIYFEDDVNSRPAKVSLTDIALTAKNISNLAGTNFTSELSLRWNKEGSIKTETIASLTPPTFEIRLDLDQVDLGSLDAYLEPQLNLFILGSKLGLHGRVHLRTPQGELPNVTFHGDASLDDFRTADGSSDEDLLKWNAFHLNGIRANLNPPKVSVEEIVLDQAYARLVIETNRTINLLNALRLTNTNAPATNETKIAAAPKKSKLEMPQTSAATNSSLPQFSIGTIIITNSVVSYSDRSISPNVNLTIEQMNGSISNISSEPLQPAGIQFAAKVDGVGPIAINGLLDPFDPGFTNEVKVSFQDVDLTPLSPYTGKFAGYGLAEGKLDLDLTYVIVGKKLAAKNLITLDQFTFGEKVASPEATHLPVRLAIAILKDRNGKIILDVPIGGSLDDPKFRIGKVVTRALVNILEKVATSPFSLLGAVFGGGGEELGYQDFAPGSYELSPADEKKLDSLAKGLFARPGLQLEISGSVAPEADREGLQRAALDQEIRRQLWLKLRKSERATNAVDQIVIASDERAHWIEKIYAQKLSDGTITPELIAANTNLAAYATQVLPRRVEPEKGGAQLIKRTNPQITEAITPATYQTQLVPPPDPTEAVLLATYTIAESDLETLAANRAKAVKNYLLQNDKIEAARLFLTTKNGALRSDGSRAYLQFR